MPQTERVKVDENFYQLLDLFSSAAEEENVPWLMVGATARILLLEKVYDWPRGIATEDTDFAVQVESWEHYEKLCLRLSEQDDLKPLQKPTKRFVTSKNLLFDLVPFGGVETGIKQVYWPPHNDELMTVRGFASAYKDAISVSVNNTITVPVISPRALCALKLFAWQERHAQHPGRDAKDLAYLFKNIESLFPAEDLHSKYQEALIKNDYDIELASLYQFGQTI
ncbi:MAG: nucleotidyl transferase AbiEii/AbiGii toxin family protein, partial [Thiohalomonadales bacterium]